MLNTARPFFGCGNVNASVLQFIIGAGLGAFGNDALVQLVLCFDFSGNGVKLGAHFVIFMEEIQPFALFVVVHHQIYKWIGGIAPVQTAPMVVKLADFRIGDWPDGNVGKYFTAGAPPLRLSIRADTVPA